jgi:hypothetical protein
MLGFSLAKLLLLAVLIAILWYGVKYARRIEQVHKQLRAELRRRQAAGGAGIAGAEELMKCRVCNAYVAARGAGPCGRRDCPWALS